MNYYKHSSVDFLPPFNRKNLESVYALATTNFEFVKIGRTNSIKNRMSNIQAGCPFDLFIWMSIKTPKTHEIERELHQLMNHRKVRGEWFSLFDEDLDFLSNYFDFTNANVKEVLSALL